MPSTYTSSLRIEEIGSGEQNGTWGNTTNTNWELIEQAVAGVVNVALGGADVTLTAINGGLDQSRNMVIVASGAPGAVRAIIAPLVPKVYAVINNTSGGFGVTIRGATGNSVTIPWNMGAFVYCDGTDFHLIETGSAGAFTVNGALTVTGAAALNGGGTSTTPSAGDNSTAIATTAFVQAALASVYPVGSIYINAAVATNPATLLGFGTWEAFGSGRVMVGVNASDPYFDTLGKTGGSSDAVVVEHTHPVTGTTNTTGNHSHAQRYGNSTNETQFTGVRGLGNVGTLGTTGTAGNHSHTVSGTAESVGEPGAGKNLQPYITVYMWRRTA